MCAILCHRGLHINVNNNNNRISTFYGLDRHRNLRSYAK